MLRVLKQFKENASTRLVGPALNPLSPSPWWSELDNLGAAFPSNLSRSLSAHCPFSSPGAAPLALKRRDGSEPTNPQEGPEVPSWLSPAHLTDWGSSLRLGLSIPPHVRLLPTALNTEPAHPSPRPSAPRGPERRACQAAAGAEGGKGRCLPLLPRQTRPHPVSLNCFLDFIVSSDVCLSQQPQSFSAPLFASSSMSCPDLADF